MPRDWSRAARSRAPTASCPRTATAHHCPGVRILHRVAKRARAPRSRLHRASRTLTTKRVPRRRATPNCRRACVRAVRVPSCRRAPASTPPPPAPPNPSARQSAATQQPSAAIRRRSVATRQHGAAHPDLRCDPASRQGVTTRLTHPRAKSSREHPRGHRRADTARPNHRRCKSAAVLPGPRPSTRDAVLPGRPRCRERAARRHQQSQRAPRLAPHPCQLQPRCPRPSSPHAPPLHPVCPHPQRLPLSPSPRRAPVSPPSAAPMRRRCARWIWPTRWCSRANTNPR